MSLYFQYCVLHFFVKNLKIEYDPHFWGGEIFWKIGERKIQNGCHFWQVKSLLKLGKVCLHRYPMGQKFCRNPTSKFLFYEENGFKEYSHISIVLYVYLMSLYFQFCVLHFSLKIQKLNMTPIFGEEKICGKLERVLCLDTLRAENFNEITLYGKGDTNSFVFYSLIKLLMLN